MNASLFLHLLAILFIYDFNMCLPKKMFILSPFRKHQVLLLRICIYQN